jgi:hypothetical protein
MNAIISVESASKGLITLFSINLFIHLFILLNWIEIPQVYLQITASHFHPQLMVGIVLLLSFIVILFTLIKTDYLLWRIKNTWLTFFFGLFSILSFSISVYLISEARILPVLFTILVTLFFWKLTLYPTESPD